MGETVSNAKSASRRKALGRGLAALMPPPSPKKPDPGAAASAALRVLPIEKIHPNKKQPRKHFEQEALEELTTSIRAFGVLQPLVVRKDAAGYEIVAGERRWRAASRAGITLIPVVVKEYSDAHALQAALIENVQRADLDPLEEAEAYSRLIREHQLSHERIAAAVGKSRSAITNSLRLLKLPPSVLAMLADGRLSAGHARALMSLDDAKLCMGMAQDIVGRQASVRQAEAQAQRLMAQRKRSNTPQGRAGPSVSENSAVGSVQDKLQQALKTKVRLQQRGGRGRLEIYFHSLDALDGILDVILR